MWAVLLFTLLNSIGTGVVTNGIFFLTDHGFGFSRTANFGLGVFLGITYVAGAFAARPIVNAALRNGRGERAVLAWIMLIMGALCCLPLLVYGTSVDATESPWSIWVLVGIYSPLAGVLWPLVESFVSGGRSGHDLRRTIGLWNIVWSSAIVFAYLAIAPLTKAHPTIALLALGGVHVAAALLLMAFSSRPKPHVHEEHQPHPKVYEQLLIVFRLLLPTSYIALSALGPYLPSILEKLIADTRWQTVLVNAWLVPRVLTFALLARWGGWHGRWWAAIAGGVLMVAGFAAIVLGPAFVDSGVPGAAGPVASFVTIIGLGCFGVGMGVIYSGALYYAMEVGKAEVDAAGKHEALIGAGYTLGPGIGLAASVAVEAAIISAAAFAPTMLGGVGIIVLAVTGIAISRISRRGRSAVGGGS
jgi:hypothetical protein